MSAGPLLCLFVLLAKGDYHWDESRQACILFQPTPLVRGATYLYAMIAIVGTISIHAPRERSDC